MNNKYIKSLVISLLCAVVAAMIMITFQKTYNNSLEEKLADKLLSEIPAKLDSESLQRKNLAMEYDLLFRKDIASIKFVMETDGPSDFFERLRANNLSLSIYLVNKEGVIINAADCSIIGKNIDEVCSLSSDDYRLIMTGEGFVNTDVKKSADGHLFKVFATEYNGNRLVMSEELKGKAAAVYSIESLGGVFGWVDSRLLLISIDNTTLKIGPFNNYYNQPLSVLNLDESVTRMPSSGHSEVMGMGYKYKTIQYKSDVLGDHTIMATYADDGTVPLASLVVLFVTIMLVTFLLSLYCQYIDEEPEKLQIRVRGLRPILNTSFTFDVEKARTILPFSLISIVVVTLLSLYLNTLNLVADQGLVSMENSLRVSESFGNVEKKYLNNYNVEADNVATFLHIISSVLDKNQKTLLNCKDAERIKRINQSDGSVRFVEICNPWLAELAKIDGANDISLYDENGKLISTSGTQRNLEFSREDTTTSAVFDVIDGVAKSQQFITGDFLVVAVPFTIRGNDTFQDALLISRFRMDSKLSISIANVVNETLANTMESSDTHYIVTTTSDDHSVVYMSKMFGQEGVSLPPAAYSDIYLGYVKVKGVKYMVVTNRVDINGEDYFILSLTPRKQVFSYLSMNTVSAFVIITFVVLVLLGTLLIYAPQKTKDLTLGAENEVETRKSMSAAQLKKLNIEIRKGLSSSQNILRVLGKAWMVILFCVTLVLIKGLINGPIESLAGYLMSFNWQRGINIFSITTMLLITLSFSFALYVLTNLISVLIKALNGNAETICLLLISLLRYAGYITVVFITLYMFGVDTTGVLASLGAFSVMVGLGAKNLITDILAGISIIMEKDYKVGDIVNIGGFCGKVNEIGIRTTKVEDIEGNVKIFYNSGINGVINMTSSLSAVRMDVKLDSKHSFNEVETKLSMFFQRISGKYIQIKGECNYLGVQESTREYNIFRIAVPCDEIDRVPLRRALIKELSEFCKDEDIIKV